MLRWTSQTQITESEASTLTRSTWLYIIARKIVSSGKLTLSGNFIPHVCYFQSWASGGGAANPCCYPMCITWASHITDTMHDKFYPIKLINQSINGYPLKSVALSNLGNEIIGNNVCMGEGGLISLLNAQKMQIYCKEGKLCHYITSPCRCFIAVSSFLGFQEELEWIDPMS